MSEDGIPPSPGIEAEWVPCGLCGGSDFVHAIESLRLERCKSCGLVQVNPRRPMAQIVERYSKEYFLAEYIPLYQRQQAISESERNHYLDCLEARRGSSKGEKSMLDIGAGPGFSLAMARDRGWNVAGIEISEFAAEYAREKLGVQVIGKPLSGDLFPQRSFDAITMFDLIEHLPAPGRSLAEAAAWLKPGGILLIVTPNFASLPRRILGSEAYGLWPDEHLTYFTRRTLRAMLMAAGFSKAEVSTRDIYPPNMARLLGRSGAASSDAPAGELRSQFANRPLLQWIRSGTNATVFRFLSWGDKLVAFAVR